MRAASSGPGADPAGGQGVERGGGGVWNVPNSLSLSRVVAVFLIAGLLAWPGEAAGRAVWGAWAAGVVYLLAAATDGLDGWAARRWNQVTTLGKFLDALVDKIFVLGVMLVLLEPGWGPPLWPGFSVAAALILAREFGVTGLRILAAQRQVVLAAERGGKVKTALQMTALGLLLLGLALSRQGASAGGGDLPSLAPTVLAVGQSLLWLSVGQAVISGCGYFQKYPHCWREDR